MATTKSKYCDLENKIQSYFDYCDELNSAGNDIVKPYTLSGLLSFLCITRDEFAKMMKIRKYAKVLNAALSKIEAYIEENSLTGGLSINASANSLKYNFGWGEHKAEQKCDDNAKDILIDLSDTAKEYAK